MGFLVSWSPTMARRIHLWINERRGPQSKPSDRVFKEAGLTHGLAYASDGKPRAGMGIAAGDIFGDGGESIIVTNLPTEAFTLFQRQSNGDFVDATEQSGLSHISLPYTGFGVGLFDMANNGLLDMFSANGGVRAMAGDLSSNPKGDPFPYRERKLLLRNMGKGKGFEDITATAGPALATIEVSRSAAFGDVNNDGGTDILVTNNNGPARLLLNTVPNRGHWLLVHLEGTKTNRSAYGSVVEVVRKDGTSVKAWVRGDGSYLAANDPRVHFGLGKDTEVNRIQVHWLAGECESWKQTGGRHDRESQGRHGAALRRGALAIFEINLEEDDEPLKGKPRTVRLEKTEYPLGQSALSLAVVTDFDTDRRVTERRAWRPNGTLSFDEAFRYEADPRACTIQILNAEGAIVSTRRILNGLEGDESVVTNAWEKYLKRLEPGGIRRAESSRQSRKTPSATRRSACMSTILPAGQRRSLLLLKAKGPISISLPVPRGRR